MKKFMFAVMAMATMLFTASCGQEENGKDDGGDLVVKESKPEVKATDGAFTVVVRFNIAPCNDVAFIGSYLNAKGEASSWGLDAAAVIMEPVEGTKTWFKAVIYPDSTGCATGKPVQLQDDGSMDWGGQPALNTLTLMEGNCTMTEENGGEIKFDFDASSSAVVYAEATGWKVDPCVVEPVAEEAWIKHASANEEINWVPQKMTKKSEGTFTYDLVYSDNGFNIGTDESCAAWYAPETIEGLDAEKMAGQNITVTFVSESGAKGKVSVALK